MDLCKDGMFWCAFELVFGVGLAVIALLFIWAMVGLSFESETKEKK